jgi:biopolymer transport protein ExbD
MKKPESINLPPSFTDLAFLLMFIFILITMALATEARLEYQTKVDLLQHQQIEGQGKGTADLSVAITENNGQYVYTIESQKQDNKIYSKLTDALVTLQDLRPPIVIIRGDKKAPWEYPHRLMVELKKLEIPFGVASQEVQK